MAVAVAGITVLHPENPLSEIKSIISNYSIGLSKEKPESQWAVVEKC